MTVIAWHGATKTLAADRMASNGNTAFATKKLFEVDGHFMGLAGDGAGIGAFVEWFESGADPAGFPSTLSNGNTDSGVTVSALVVDPEGNLCLYESSPYPMAVLDENFAIGSGAEIALTAMMMGKNAIEAVELASKLTVTCGMGCDSLSLISPPVSLKSRFLSIGAKQ
jgi:hypothetical protein